MTQTSSPTQCELSNQRMVVSMILMISGNSDADDVCLHGTDMSDYNECRVTCGEGQCYCSVVHNDEDLDMNGCLTQI